MSGRNPVHDQPTAQERAAFESRRRENLQRVTRPGPVETWIGGVASGVWNWAMNSSSRPNGVTSFSDAQMAERNRREAQAQAAEAQRVQAQRSQASAARVAANTPTQEEIAFQKAKNTRVDQLTPEQRRLIRQGRPDTPGETMDRYLAQKFPLDKALAGTSTQTETGRGSNAPAGTTNRGGSDRRTSAASPAEENNDLKNPNFRKATDFDKNNPFNKNNTENRQFELNRITGNSFNIDRFRAEVVGEDDVLTTHSYLVVFSPMPWVTSRATRDGIESRLTMRCDNAILPTVSLLQEQNIRRYGFGPVENVAYGVNVGDFTLQFIVDKRGTIVDFFETWLNTIVNRDSYGGANMNNALRDGKRPYEVAYKDTYVCPSVNVFVYDRSQNTVMEYNIYDVFPTGIQSMNLSWGEENSLMKLNVTFSFTDLRIHPKFSNFDNQQIVPVADTLQDAPITVATMGDKPLVDQLTSVNVPADLANLPFVLGEGTNGALRSYGTPGDTPAADDGGATGSSDVRASTRRTPLGPPY